MEEDAKMLELYFSGCTYREIAAQVGIPLASAYTRIRRLKKQQKEQAATKRYTFHDKEKSVKERVNVRVRTFINAGLYDEAIDLLDNYINHEDLSENEIEGIKRIKAILESRIEKKLRRGFIKDNENEQER